LSEAHSLLALLGFFVSLYNKTTRLQTLSHNPIASPLEIFVLLAGLALAGSIGVVGLSAF
jgi:hypothetical protein